MEGVRAGGDKLQSRGRNEHVPRPKPPHRPRHSYLPEKPVVCRLLQVQSSPKSPPGALAGPGIGSYQTQTTDARTAAAGQSADKEHQPVAPESGPALCPELVLTLTKSRKSSKAARPRAAVLSCATWSKLVNWWGRPRRKRVHWRSAVPSWARRTSAAAAVSATRSHCAQVPGLVACKQPSLRQARASATEK